jgi:hypothetical protein
VSLVSQDLYPLRVRGMNARAVERDPAIHTPETEGKFWDQHPEDTGQALEWWAYAHLRPTPDTVTEPAPAEEPVRLSAPATGPLTEWEKVPRPLDRGEPDLRAFFALFKAINRGGRPDLSPEEIACLNVMLTYCTHVTLGDCRPGQERLAQGLGKSTRQVRRYLGALTGKRYIVLVRKGSGYGNNRADEYRLTLPEWEAET